MIRDRPYQGYAYSYPHKSAYRRFDPVVPLGPLWERERRDGLFLYLHVPFCEMRCGFCNLFTRALPGDDEVAAYLTALERQARVVRACLPVDVRFVRLAIGGGTPTHLPPGELARLLDVADGIMGAEVAGIPAGVETSPATAVPDRLGVLRDRGIDRVSLGVQSLVDSEIRGAGRAQTPREVTRAIAAIRDAGFPTLNLDLIYGLPGQTPRSVLASLENLLAHEPEEVYLYPLYVRPLTGLGRRGPMAEDPRPACYRAGRDRLRAGGYEQVSMRMFRRSGAGGEPGPRYSCQDDGLVGLGCGARSYTRSIHHATEFAVSRGGVREILADYVHRPARDFASAWHGIRLSPGEERRRFLIQGILQVEGLDLDGYRSRFGSVVREDFPEVATLEADALATADRGRLRLTETGLGYSDAIGPLFYSPEVRRAMEELPVR